MNKKLAETDKEIRNDQQQISDCITKAMPMVEKYLYDKKNNSVYYRSLVNKHKKKIENRLWKIAGINFAQLLAGIHSLGKMILHSSSYIQREYFV